MAEKDISRKISSDKFCLFILVRYKFSAQPPRFYRIRRNKGILLITKAQSAYVARMLSRVSRRNFSRIGPCQPPIIRLMAISTGAWNTYTAKAFAENHRATAPCWLYRSLNHMRKYMEIPTPATCSQQDMPMLCQCRPPW